MSISRVRSVLLLLLLSSLTWAKPSTVEQEARTILARFKKEPDVKAVQKAALEYAVMNPELIRSMHTRSRVAPLLPELKLRVAKDLDDESKSLTRFSESNQPEDISATEVKGDDLSLQGELKWQLDELIFNTGETSVMKENRYTARERRQLLRLVTELYFSRRKAQVKLLTRPPKDASRRVMADLQIAQLTAELDSLTGGRFSMMIEEE